MENKIEKDKTLQVWVSSGHPPATEVPFKVEVIGGSGSGLGFLFGGSLIAFGLWKIAEAIIYLADKMVIK